MAALTEQVSAYDTSAIATTSTGTTSTSTADDGAAATSAVKVMVTEGKTMVTDTGNYALMDAAGNVNPTELASFLTNMESAACHGLEDATCEAIFGGMASRRRLESAAVSSRRALQTAASGGSSAVVNITRNYDFGASANASLPVEQLIATGLAAQNVSVTSSTTTQLEATSTVVTLGAPTDNDVLTTALSTNALSIALASKLPTVGMSIGLSIIGPPALPPATPGMPPMSPPYTPGSHAPPLEPPPPPYNVPPFTLNATTVVASLVTEESQSMIRAIIIGGIAVFVIGSILYIGIRFRFNVRAVTKALDKMSDTSRPTTPQEDAGAEGPTLASSALSSVSQGASKAVQPVQRTLMRPLSRGHTRAAKCLARHIAARPKSPAVSQEEAAPDHASASRARMPSPDPVMEFEPPVDKPPNAMELVDADSEMTPPPEVVKRTPRSASGDAPITPRAGLAIDFASPRGGEARPGATASRAAPHPPAARANLLSSIISSADNDGWGEVEPAELGIGDGSRPASRDGRPSSRDGGLIIANARMAPIPPQAPARLAGALQLPPVRSTGAVNLPAPPTCDPLSRLVEMPTRPPRRAPPSISITPAGTTPAPNPEAMEVPEWAKKNKEAADERWAAFEAKRKAREQAATSAKTVIAANRFLRGAGTRAGTSAQVMPPRRPAPQLPNDEAVQEETSGNTTTSSEGAGAAPAPAQ